MSLVRSQQGVALAILLWFIAALALLVAGLMGLSRSEVSNVRWYLAQAQTEAVGDAVARLVTQGLVRRATFSDSALLGSLQFDSYLTRVRVVPADGLVDMLAAPPELLEVLFSSVTELEPANARALVGSVIEWRTSSIDAKNRRGSADVVYVVEDSMRVRGLSRLIFERLKPYICVNCNGGRLVLQHAPRELKTILLQAGWADSEGRQLATDEWLQVPGRARLDIRVKMSDGAVYQRSVWVLANGAISLKDDAFRVKQLEFESDSIVE